MSTIQNEIWASTISKLLFQEDLSFLNKAKRWDDYVQYGKVNVPIAGGGIGVTKNPSGINLTATQRTDTILTFNVDNYATDLMAYTYVEELQTSYEKRASIVEQQAGVLSQRIGTEVLNAWSRPTAENAVFTTGVTSSVWLEGSQTGTRRLITSTDLLKLKNALDAQRVPQNGRVLVLPSTMLNALLTNEDIKSAMDFYGTSGNILPEARLPKIAGFEIIERPSVVAYAAGTTASAVKLAVQSDGTYTIGATDNLAGLAFHRDMVASAFGGVQVFQGIPGDPKHYGGQEMSAIAQMGASPLYSNYTGVAMLVMGT